MRCTETANRYGFDVFHHPRPRALLFSQESESGLLHILDHCEELYTRSEKFPAFKTSRIAGAQTSPRGQISSARVSAAETGGGSRS